MIDVRMIIDKDNFKKLQRELGGRRIWIPKLGNLGVRNKAYYERRNDQIRKMRRASFSVENIATRFGLSKKRVYNILNCNIDES